MPGAQLQKDSQNIPLNGPWAHWLLWANHYKRFLPQWKNIHPPTFSKNQDTTNRKNTHTLYLYLNFLLHKHFKMTGSNKKRCFPAARESKYPKLKLRTQSDYNCYAYSKDIPRNKQTPNKKIGLAKCIQPVLQHSYGTANPAGEAGVLPGVPALSISWSLTFVPHPWPTFLPQLMGPRRMSRKGERVRKGRKTNTMVHYRAGFCLGSSMTSCSVSQDRLPTGHMSECILGQAPERGRGKNLPTGSHFPLAKGFLHEVLTPPHIPVALQALSRSVSVGNPQGGRWETPGKQAFVRLHLQKSQWEPMQNQQQRQNK